MEKFHHSQKVVFSVNETLQTHHMFSVFTWGFHHINRPKWIKKHSVLKYCYAQCLHMFKVYSYCRRRMEKKQQPCGTFLLLADIRKPTLFFFFLEYEQAFSWQNGTIMNSNQWIIKNNQNIPASFDRWELKVEGSAQLKWNTQQDRGGIQIRESVMWWLMTGHQILIHINQVAFQRTFVVNLEHVDDPLWLCRKQWSGIIFWVHIVMDRKLTGWCCSLLFESAGTF